MAGKYMNEPETISVSRKNISNADISHEYCVTTPSNSYQALRRIADINPDIYGIVFCRTRQETKDIADKLMADGYNADALHGDLSQAQRDYVMGRFRNRHLQILVATDVAARGLDVDNLTHVIHYHLPDDPENYIHRSGRTGRAGHKGISIAILAPAERRRISFIEKQTGQKLKACPIPSGEEVFKKRMENYLDNVATAEATGFDISKFETIITEKLGSFSKEEIIEKFVALGFNKLHNDYKNATDLNSAAGSSSSSRERSPRGIRGDRDRGARGDRGDRDSRNKFTRYSINIGSKNDLRPDVLISLINRQTPDTKIAIGKIDIQSKTSIFEADGEHEQQLIQAFKKARYKGLPLTLQTIAAEKRTRRKPDDFQGSFGKRSNFPRRKRN
jgi:ATP-dependent RNA helicase DeaD